LLKGSQKNLWSQKNCSFIIACAKEKKKPSSYVMQSFKLNPFSKTNTYATTPFDTFMINVG
jgi:hypothetical protein